MRFGRVSANKRNDYSRVWNNLPTLLLLISISRLTFPNFRPTSHWFWVAMAQYFEPLDNLDIIKFPSLALILANLAFWPILDSKMWSRFCLAWPMVNIARQTT